MKQTSLLSLFAFLLIINLASCKEDESMDWKIQNEQWMTNLKETNKTDPNFHVTPSGLCYKVIHQGYGRMPKPSSYIYANYKGSLIDNSVFEQATNAEFWLSTYIPGWREGLLLMNGGGRYIFYIPSALGYGKDASGKLIAPYSVLVFDVELLDSEL